MTKTKRNSQRGNPMFNAKEQTEKIISFIRDYFEKNHLGGVVLGISGGKDSAAVAGLFSLALGKENVVGLTLPCHSMQSDSDDAHKVAEKFGFELLNVDLTEVDNIFQKELKYIAGRGTQIWEVRLEFF